MRHKAGVVHNSSSQGTDSGDTVPIPCSFANQMSLAPMTCGGESRIFISSEPNSLNVLVFDALSVRRPLFSTLWDFDTSVVRRLVRLVIAGGRSSEKMAVAVLGWQPSPQLRGTWQIIWNCIQTILLCAWVSVCPNAPSPVDGKWDLITDKFFFILLTLLGPDLVFMLAFGQWRNARASLPLFHASGYTDWTMTHAFFADMGGIHVKPPNWKSFPVNAKQLHYLIQRKYMNYPCIKKDDIEALGKTDVLARYVLLSREQDPHLTSLG